MAELKPRLARFLRRVADRLAAPAARPVHWRPGGGNIFCIGRNKTGTTSLQRAFLDLGYTVGDQRRAEQICDSDYFKRDFQGLIEYCRSAQVFQDVPFSYPYTYVILDHVFPGSKFILSVRDSPEQWYSSVSRFHGKLFGTAGKPPTADQLRKALYVREGFAYNTVKVHGTTDRDPYAKETMMAHYQRHNENVRDYFRFRPDDLLVLNLAEPGSYRRFVEFLGVESTADTFPWENAT
ncbi:MAG: hypothetical protein IPM46_10600 [Flavobacteriales bacterium]|nr:hypothetical protein [Flavobacteriales bacterium]